MWRAIFGAITGFFGGGIGDAAREVREILDRRLDAETEKDLARVEAELTAKLADIQLRIAMRDSPWAPMNLVQYLIGISGAMYYASIAFVSTFPFWGWEVKAMPPEVASAFNIWLAYIMGAHLIRRIR